METNDFNNNVGKFSFDTPESEEEKAANELGPKEKNTITGMVLKALHKKGGMDYLLELGDKDFVRMLTTAISAEAKVKGDVTAHEDFLRVLQLKTRQLDMNERFPMG